MLDKVISLLQSAGLAGWEVFDVKTVGWEFYFVRHALDQHRVKEVEHLILKVYQRIEDGKWLGFASAELPLTAGEDEAAKLVEDLAYRATLVKNRPYTLNPLKAAHTAPGEKKTVDVERIARDFLETMRDLPETEGEDVNSYEIFVSEKTRRLVTSEGIDITETYPDSMIEVVINARNADHEIELYRSYKSGNCDTEGLKKDLLRTMQYGRDRLRTSPTPPIGKADVLFSTEDAVRIYSYFSQRLNPQMVYRKMSDWEIGKPISEKFQGDRISLYALRELPNSSANRRFDAEGAPITDTVMLRNGVPEQYLGGRMFSAYMGLDNSFIPGNLAAEGGTHSEEELRSGTFLEVVEFSDFQVDSLTGDIFGEIRLGYWHEGNQVTPVSGGSISGSMQDFIGDMLLSRDQVQYDRWRIPALTRLKNVTVTGIE